ncbi:unnamed protein product, partial [Pylaiella littoralis]
SVAGALAASNTEECAKLVPTEERRRGKGAFFSGCTSRSTTSSRGGCWSSLVEEESGCQTCIVQHTIRSVTSTTDDDEWVSSVFNTYFEMELDPCPISVADIYGTPEGGIVSSKEVKSDDCGADDGWLAFEASCYSKSSFLDVALTWDDADARCGELGARLVSLETADENDFVIHNLLWIGFLGEAYMGLRKKSWNGVWSWNDSLIDFPPGEFNSSASFQDWGEGLDASSFYEVGEASCLEITPYFPKAWKPFSCEVHKQYVCEKPALPSSSPQQQSATTTAPAVSPPSAGQGLKNGNTLAPAAGDAGVTGPVVETGPPISATGMELPTEAPTGSPTASPTGSPTGSPTAAPTNGYHAVEDGMTRSGSGGGGYSVGSCAEGLGEYETSFLAQYDMQVYSDAAGCAENASTAVGSSPDWCNSFEIRPECRSCWTSCDGARKFLDDYTWLRQDMILFCPWINLTNFVDACDSSNSTARGNGRRSLREKISSF